MIKRAAKYLSQAAVAMALLALASPAAALDQFEARLKVEKAAMTVKDFMVSPDSNAPRYLLRRARAVVIVPGMVKGGFVIGGEYGNGVVVARDASGTWSPPAFVTLAGATVGFQIGAQSMDLFMLVMNEAGLRGILDNQLKFGADAAVTAGPVGRSTEAALSGMDLTADIYSYSRSKGAFAGATLEGGGVQVDPAANEAYYGKPLTPADILFEGKVEPPPSARQLLEVLEQFAQKP
jgi:lipid-binding SYLF domain-containing protein